MYIYFQILTTLNLNVAKLSIHGKVLEKHWARSCYSQPEIGICQTAANEAKYNIERWLNMRSMHIRNTFK